MSSAPTRWEYTGPGLTEDELAPTPWQQAQLWVDQAAARAETDPALHEPSQLAVATVDATGMPDVRVVLMRFFSPAGPGFISHRVSRKADQISAHQVMAASLTWSALFRAIRFRGAAVEIDSADTTAYWRSRPWPAQISAWASHQSQPTDSRTSLQAAYDECAARWPEGTEVPVPEDWVGWRIEPVEVEFWAGRPGRLHDRIRFTKVGAGDLDTAQAWSWVRLQP